MPSEHQIPARTERRCEPCEYHKLIGAFHVRSGRGSYREYMCNHPDMNEGLTEAARALFGGGKYIGKTEKQPDWCPLRREPANDKISEDADRKH